MPNNFKEIIEKIGVQNIIIGVLSVVLLYVLYRSFSFSTTDNVDKKIDSLKTQMLGMKSDLSGQMNMLDARLANSVSQLANSREMTISRSLYRAPYINIVNRRMIPLTTNVIPWTSSSESTKTELISKNVAVYDPFAYNVPPPAPGAKRKWRFYAVWADTLSQKPGTQNIDTFGFFVRLATTIAPGKTPFNMDFKFYGTCGGHVESRDGVSKMMELPSVQTDHSILSGWIDGRCTIRCATDSTLPDHVTYYTGPSGSLQGGSNGSNAEVKFYYLEFQALDVYE